jgi:hypothetical protein
MTKILERRTRIEINQCGECPAFNPFCKYCMEKGLAYVTLKNFSPPSWCPLPDKKQEVL